MIKKLLIGTAAIIALGLIYIGYSSIPEGKGFKLGAVTSSDFTYYSSDVIGTHIGTSTVGVAFTGATSTYVSKIGTNKVIANYTIIATAVAAGTPSMLFSVQGSNDYACDTNVTSTAGEVLVSNINWFDVGAHLVNKNVNATTSNVFTNTSSSQPISWTPAVGVGQEILLNNLNYNCLRLIASGASSTIYAGLATK